MNMDRLPRWFLVTLTAGSLTLVGLLGKFAISNAYERIDSNAADLVKVKAIAYDAKNTAAISQLAIAELRGAIQDIKNSNDKFRTEYREDQAELKSLIKRH